ncbi:MAG: tetratricopeptide (TPR) repeat protein [Crocinitomicaceae bacterium]|jgi:tetratricopeptide (TPR) repeat protein
MSKWIINIIFGVLPWVALAGSNFDEGIKAFQDKKYELAIEKFQASLTETPNDAASYYNLGLAQHESKSYGKAIWAFEKVLSLSPADNDAKDRIEQSYLALDPDAVWQPRLNRLESALYGFSGSSWSIIAIIFSLLLSGCAILFLRTKQVSTKRLCLALGFLSLCLLVASLFIAAGASNYSEQTKFALVTKKHIPTYQDAKKISKVTLKEGDRVEIMDEKHTDLVSVSSNSGDTYLVKATDLDFI